MEKVIRFYRKEDTMNWYAFLPDYLLQGGTEEECEMVCGADIWLQTIAGLGKTELTLKISDEKFEGTTGCLELMKSDEDGAIYDVGWYNKQDYRGFYIWLCSVTLFVFGEYPKKIFYTVIW